eukprot:1859520-Amphidinium_carterae.1
MTVRFRIASSMPTRSIVRLHGATPSRKKSGSAEFMLNLTWPRIYAMKGRAQGRSAMPVEYEAAERCHLPSASFATTGPVCDTWRSQPAWPEPTQCVRHTRSWSTAPQPTTHTFASTGDVLSAAFGL